MQHRSGRQRVAIFDNNEIENLLRLKNTGIDVTPALDAYDYILIPGWVWEEVADSEFRIQFVQDLKEKGCPIQVIPEQEYVRIIKQELLLLKVFQMSIYPYAQLKTVFRRDILKNKEAEDIDYMYREWIPEIYQKWPFAEKIIIRSSGEWRIQKKNAGEVSVAFLAGVLKLSRKDLIEVTIWSGDSDCRLCMDTVTERMRKQKLIWTDEEIAVSYKNLDVVLKEFCDRGWIDHQKSEEVIDSIRNNREIQYLDKKSDNSCEIKTIVVDNVKFKEVVKNENITLIW